MASFPATPIWAVIPVKPFALGKSRLALGEGERAAINRGFLTHVLGVAAAVLPASHIVIVSHDEDALAMARAAGARALREDGVGGLNDALAQGARFADERGAQGVLSLFTDLPDLTPDDLHAMLGAFSGGNLVLAPDEQGSGTNAMLMPPNRVPYRHGADSLWRHLEAARDAQVDFALVRRTGLMRDVDTADQLRVARTEPSRVDPC
jgi:2-phospho-L-lactate guanylyltransferase